MPSRHFQFAPQPVLDRALSEQEHCQRNLAVAIQNVAFEQAEVRRGLDRLKETRQQIRIEYDNLVVPLLKPLGAVQLLARSRYIQSLEEREAAEVVMLDQQRQRLRDAQQILADRRDDLARKTAEVKVLEKLKETRLAEFKADLARAEETERDDQATQQWNRKPM